MAVALTDLEVVPVAQGYDVVATPEMADGQLIYLARHPDLPRCIAQGPTPEIAIAYLAEVREDYLADMRQAGVPVAAPKDHPRVEVMRALPVIDTASHQTMLGSWRVVSGPLRLVEPLA